jgi:hypothetical protein
MALLLSFEQVQRQIGMIGGLVPFEPVQAGKRRLQMLPRHSRQLGALNAIHFDSPGWKSELSGWRRGPRKTIVK